ncbi:PAS domain-containing protein [Paracoccus yeei]|uniref:PAS domain-containing protein n=1 Tax=Paracoccus yeei TaxID=147645 RepID=UPI0006878E35|nr:PAS domain-containing protein [Paracoccus yeei]OWJ88796.1 hypothetical protein CDV54_20860 [Paracoccus yeei]
MIAETPADGSSNPPVPELERRLAQQALIAEFGRFALKNDTLQAILDEACRIAADGLEVGFAKVLEPLPMENALLLRAGIGWRPGLVGHARIGADLESPAGYAFKTGEPVISNHLSEEKRFRTPKLMADHGVKRAVNVIIQGEGVPFGVLEADSRDPGAFNPHDIHFLQALANTLGVAIDKEAARSRIEELGSELAQREAHLRRAVELNPQIPWAADAEGRIVEFNERWLNRTGLTLQDAEGEGWLEAIHPDDRSASLSAWRDAIEMGTAFDIEYRVRMANGDYRWMRSHAHPWRDARGGIAMWYGATEDIHERKLAEQAVAQSEERLSIAVDAAALGLFDHDLVTGTIDWDGRIRDIWGIGAEEPVSFATFAEGIHPEDKAAMQAALDQALDPRGDGRSAAQYRVLRRSDKDTRWVAAYGRTTFAEGRPVRLVGIVQDVTTHVVAEERLRRALADKDLLSREIDHRIKNSLSMVGGLLRMQERAVSSQEAKDALAEASTRVLSVARIHEQLYRSANMDTVEFGGYLQRLTEDIATSLGSAKAQITVEATTMLLPIDQALPLGLIASELLTNALKHARRGDEPVPIQVHFGPGQDKEGFTLVVADQGRGLPEGFDMRSQAGLGMRLIVSLSSQLDATVETINTAQGAQFTVSAGAETS